ncbi:MAG: ABC transporter permease [Alphaproteobacteria bacterium]|nr:ABC transporter permease [Alphaproteobacteria bacterium]
MLARPRARAASWLVLATRAIFVAAFGAFVVGPIAVLVLWSIAQQWFWPSPLPSAYTLRWYAWALDVPNVLRSLQMSLVVAVLVTAVTTAVALPAAWVIGRVPFRGKAAVRAAFALPLMVPYIALGIGIATVFYALGLAGTLGGVVLAHTIATLPFGILVLTAAVEAAEPEIEEAALACGASRWQAFRRVTLPMLAPALLSQAVYVFTLSMDEFTLTLLVSSPDTATLPVQMYAAIGEGYFQVSSALAVLLLTPSVLLIYLMVRFARTSLVSAEGG